MKKSTEKPDRKKAEAKQPEQKKRNKPAAAKQASKKQPAPARPAASPVDAPVGSKSERRLYNVLIGPVVSEKSTMIADKHNQVAFKVVQDATRVEVKAAVELLFKVQVDSVQILNRRGKEKRYGRTPGRRNHMRKAYVCLKPGQEINFAEGVK
jgi:large subunit ribosomal protein L23